MTADELIRSGLLEAYVLGQTSAEEARLVERMRSDDAVVRDELLAIENALEAHASRSAVAPPAHLKAAMLERINSEVSGHAAPGQGSPVIPLHREAPRKLNWLVAASVAGLVLSAGLNFLQYQQLKNVRGELARLENDRSVLAEELQVQRAGAERSNEQLAIVLDPRRHSVLLNGVGTAVGSKARIYWDKEAHSVYIDPMTLAALPDGKQYQLWALVNGRPVDAGVIAKGDAERGIQAMKDVPDAQAFAVTIEREGGSPTPTLEAMVLLGQV
jgi:anti-sigma-K factor RskA